MSVDFQAQAGPAALADIEALERHIGRPLPAAYREFLGQHDGVLPEDNSEAVNNVFAIGPDAPEWASLWQRLDVYADRVPTWLLPVAADAFGNLFALSLRDRDFGSVWFWDHEMEADEDEPPTEDNIECKAPDWHTFLESLQPPPPWDDDDDIVLLD